MAQTMTFKEAKQLAKDEHSCVKMDTVKRKINLAFRHLDCSKKGVKEILDNELNLYSPELNGSMMAYQKIKLQQIGKIVETQPFLSFLIELEVALFRPFKDALMKGVINKIGNDHIGLLIHKIFNCSLRKPRDVYVDLAIGQEVWFTVFKVYQHGGLTMLQGDLDLDSLLATDTFTATVESETKDETTMQASTPSAGDVGVSRKRKRSSSSAAESTVGDGEDEPDYVDTATPASENKSKKRKKDISLTEEKPKKDESLTEEKPKKDKSLTEEKRKKDKSLTEKKPKKDKSLTEEKPRKDKSLTEGKRKKDKSFTEEKPKKDKSLTEEKKSKKRKRSVSFSSDLDSFIAASGIDMTSDLTPSVKKTKRRKKSIPYDANTSILGQGSPKTPRWNYTGLKSPIMNLSARMQEDHNSNSASPASLKKHKHSKKHEIDLTTTSTPVHAEFLSQTASELSGLDESQIDTQSSKKLKKKKKHKKSKDSALDETLNDSVMSHNMTDVFSGSDSALDDSVLLTLSESKKKTKKKRKSKGEPVQVF